MAKLGTPVESSSIAALTFGQLADKYGEWVQREVAAGRMKPRTLDYYQHQLQKFLDAIGGHRLHALLEIEAQLVAPRCRAGVDAGARDHAARDLQTLVAVPRRDRGDEVVHARPQRRESVRGAREQRVQLAFRGPRAFGERGPEQDQVHDRVRVSLDDALANGGIASFHPVRPPRFALRRREEKTAELFGARDGADESKYDQGDGSPHRLAAPSMIVMSWISQTARRRAPMPLAAGGFTVRSTEQPRTE